MTGRSARDRVPMRLARLSAPIEDNRQRRDGQSENGRDRNSCRPKHVSNDIMPCVDDRYASLRDATASALLRGPGETSADLRQAIARGRPPEELTTLVQKIRSRAYTVTDEDVDALRSRYTEPQLFEIIVAAAFGAAQERLAVAHRALEDA